MHAVGARGVVLEHDLDRVADLRAQDRSQQAKVRVLRRARLPRGERRVGIFLVDRLAIDPPDVIRSRLCVRHRRSLERFARRAGRHVDVERSVVPIHFFRRDVVGAHTSASRTGIVLRLRCTGVMRVGPDLTTKRQTADTRPS